MPAASAARRFWEVRSCPRWERAGRSGSRLGPAGEAPLRASDCYRFSLSDPRVDMVLCGPSNDRQMEEASAALALGPLSAEEMARAKWIGDHMHRGAAA